MGLDEYTRPGVSYYLEPFMTLEEWIALLVGFGLGLSTAVVIITWLYAESFDEDEEMDA